MADRPDHDLADHRPTPAEVIGDEVLFSGDPDRVLSALWDAGYDVIDRAERDEYRRQLDTLRNANAVFREQAAIAEDRLIRLNTDIDAVRSCWHAVESPRWTANVIEALRHSGLMDAVDALAAVGDPEEGR